MNPFDVFVAKVTAEDDVGSKLVENIKFDDSYLTSDFNWTVDRSRDIYDVIALVSNANVWSTMLDTALLKLINDILSDEARCGSCVQHGSITSGSSSSETKIGINLVFASW